jgi:hypothetical protein
MDRRQFVQTGVAAGFATAVTPALAKLSPRKRPPNVLYVFA